MVSPNPIAQLIALKRRRRRLSNASFFVAGIGFGTMIYLLRARFELVRTARAAAAALLAITVAAFYLGARADAEVRKLDEEIAENRQKLPPNLR